MQENIERQRNLLNCKDLAKLKEGIRLKNSNNGLGFLSVGRSKKEADKIKFMEQLSSCMAEMSNPEHPNNVFQDYRYKTEYMKPMEQLTDAQIENKQRNLEEFCSDENGKDNCPVNKQLMWDALKFRSENKLHKNMVSL